MTKFEDQLLEQLMAEHGHRLCAAERPARARRRAWRPVWLVTGAAAAVAAVTAAVMTLGSAPASAAYSVTRHANGSVTVSVNRPSGVAGANATLHRMRARVAVVPVRPGCPAIGSLPRPRPAPHPAVSAGTGVGKNGHRSVTGHGEQGRHPPGRHDDPGVQQQRAQRRLSGSRGHHHRARAPLREPPVRAVAQWGHGTWTRPQPTGIRASDAVAWAREILVRYTGYTDTSNNTQGLR